MLVLVLFGTPTWEPVVPVDEFVKKDEFDDLADNLDGFLKLVTDDDQAVSGAGKVDFNKATNLNEVFSLAMDKLPALPSA